MLDFVYHINFESCINIVVSHVNFNSQYHDKYKFIIPLVWIFNVFALEVVQKCQVCVLWENLSRVFLVLPCWIHEFNAWADPEFLRVANLFFGQIFLKTAWKQWTDESACPSFCYVDLAIAVTNIFCWNKKRIRSSELFWQANALLPKGSLEWPLKMKRFSSNWMN